MRSKACLASIPVVVITADRNDDIVHEFIRLGVADYLTKPLVGRQIVARFAYILSHLQPAPVVSGTRAAS
jgi:PleD family two-component response regulator